MTYFTEDNTARRYENPQAFIKPIVRKVATGLTAAGTTIADALLLDAVVNNLGTVASGTGVQLPADLDIGSEVIVRNGGASALLVYPPSATEAINAAADDAAVSVAVTEVATFHKVSATKWIGAVAVTF